MDSRKAPPIIFQVLSLFSLNAIILFSRLNAGGRNLFKNSLWAEDGLFALCNIKATAASCMFDSFSGYWSALPRFIAFLVSRFSLTNWAVANNLLVILFLSSISSFSYWVIRSNFSSFFQPLFLVLAPSVIAGLSHEVLVVSNSIFGLLGYYLLLIYLYTDFSPFKFGIRFWIYLTYVVLYTLSNPLGLLFLVVLLADQVIFKNRSKNRFVFTLIVFCANLVQFSYVLLNHTERYQAEFGLSLIKSLIFEFIKSFTLLIYAPSNINYFSDRSARTTLVFIFLMLILLAIAYLLLKNFLVSIRALLVNPRLLFPFFTLCSSLFISVLSNGAASRFEVMTSLYAFLFVFSIFYSYKGKSSNLGIGFLVIFISLNGMFNFQASELRSSGPAWSNQLDSLHKLCGSRTNSSTHVIFAPNWSASIQHPYKVKEPTTEIVECVKLNRAH